jgi:CRP-like cAMP-binding protein
VTSMRPIAGEAALQEMEGAIGRDAAHALARRFGGTSVYVPRVIGDHHPLCVALGREAAERLSAWTGGSTIAVPKQAERRGRVLELRRRALTAAQIAVETGYSQRHVFRLLKEEEEAAQPGLFD